MNSWQKCTFLMKNYKFQNIKGIHQSSGSKASKGREKTPGKAQSPVLPSVTETRELRYLASWPEPPSLHTAAGASELLQLALLGDFLIGKKKRFFTILNIKEKLEASFT